MAALRPLGHLFVPGRARLPANVLRRHCASVRMIRQDQPVVGPPGTEHKGTRPLRLAPRGTARVAQAARRNGALLDGTRSVMGASRGRKGCYSTRISAAMAALEGSRDRNGVVFDDIVRLMSNAARTGEALDFRSCTKSSTSALCAAIVDRATPDQTAVIARALQQAVGPPEELLKALSRCTLIHRERLRPQDLVFALCAVGPHAPHRAGSLLSLVERIPREHLERLAPAILSRLAVITAQMEAAGAGPAPGWWEHLADVVRIQLRQTCPPRDYAVLVFELAGRAPQSFIDEAAARLDESLAQGLKPKHMWMVVLAFMRTGGATARKVVTRLADVSGRTGATSDGRVLSTLLWAIAQSGAASPDFVRSSAQNIVRQGRTVNLRQLIRATWALVVLGHADPALFDVLISRVSDPRACNFLSDDTKTLVQLHTVHNALALAGKNETGEVNRLEGPIWKLAASAMACCAPEYSSTLHREVSAALRLLSVPHVNEYCFPELHYFVDLAIVDRKLAILVNGPHHYVADTTELMPKFLLMQHHLAASGWTVVNIHFWEWDRARDQDLEDRNGAMIHRRALLRTCVADGGCDDLLAR